ncbi:hypothetical protein [Hyalangium gracile]|uniref:hypothetical protein n=1 Tax=Hyalangium gracile TaxID=394092 RepID=UPI001CCFF51B|nr:hypothetical protein [Hyalangium gracile]
MRGLRHGSLSMPSPPAEWRPMSAEQLARMRVVVLSSITFASLPTPVEVAKKARSCGEPAVTRCVALGEAAFWMKYLGNFARDSYPEAYASFEEELAAAPCPTGLARRMWEHGVTLEEADEARGMSGLPAGTLRWTPRGPLREVLVGNLLSHSLLSLERLKDFRQTLTAGGFKDEPRAPRR